MKKLISIMLSVLMVLSLVFVVYASGNADKGNGKNYEAGVNVTGSPSPEITPAITPADTLEGLEAQLKANHRDKAARKLLHNMIKELRKQNGDTTIPVIVNGQLVKFDVPPVIKHNRTLIPVRAVTNSLGATVAWDRATNDVTITKTVDSKAIVIVIDLDSGKIFKDGVEIILDVPAKLISNRTFVPIRFLAEAFGMKVGWDKDLDGVVVDDDDVTPSPTTTPTATADPTATPTATPTAEPTATPTAAP